MPVKHRVIGLGGSLRSGSRSVAAIRIALSAAGREVDTKIIDVATLGLPLYRPDTPLDGCGVRVRSYLEKIRSADAFVWSSPSYHGTISGSMKNALDYLDLLAQEDPPYLTGCAVGLISCAGGMTAAVNTINAMTHIAFALRAEVIPFSVPIVREWWTAGSESPLIDQRLLDRLVRLGHEAAAFAKRIQVMRSTGTRDLDLQ